MVRLWAVILLLGVVLQTFSRQLIFTEFLVKRDFISVVLCEKKSEPVNTCQGKCHLKKQLTKENERQEKNNQLVKSIADVLFSQDVTKTEFNSIWIVTSFFGAHLNSTLQKGFFAGVFHPPSC